jgi:hypothetical protein
MAIAMAMLTPKAGSCIALTKVAIPSGKLCIAMASAENARAHFLGLEPVYL